MLTTAAVKAARPRSRAYKIYDERGLYLYVAPTGLKSFRLRYRFDDREKLMTIGSWPDIALEQARDLADAARRLVEHGANPMVQARRSAAARTFEAAAREWHAHQLPRWSERHADDVITSLERDVFPEIGSRSLASIDAPAVLKVLRRVEARGHLETARRLRQRISAVFALAISEGAASADPAAIVGRAMHAPEARGRQPALLNLDQCRALLVDCDRAGGSFDIKAASRFLALTAVRLGALRGARWDEFEGLDGADALWRVPAARMKLRRANKADSQFDHIVPLAPAAVAILNDLPGDRKGLVFRGRSGRIGEGAIGALYARAGYRGRHVPHGWRASFSTILNERFPKDRDAIDLSLAHAPSNKVEAAYNRSVQIARRRRLFDAWASMLLDGAT
ncbi:tyrosine-type recombinase/integrase [Stakelama tenebrarum]|uniref:Integrase arm-type DNA-binding domain-containing protein n=1 Tax=Stakelama tenebrarum TaxID=2711215 RepID=A0A6G6Y5E9_9SPHN|nr:integrase arm-type DNA-binding domain-containing protein [Sphingosinithalassobacter tenebrarum]QIG80130.1 integrase arm-type DNA-binding domain-containing protein [Sphingosinithalassobacter tenebrarum]